MEVVFNRTQERPSVNSNIKIVLRNVRRLKNSFVVLFHMERSSILC